MACIGLDILRPQTLFKTGKHQWIKESYGQPWLMALYSMSASENTNLTRLLAFPSRYLTRPNLPIRGGFFYSPRQQFRFLARVFFPTLNDDIAVFRV